MDEITTKELLDIFERLAEQTNDGHLTIMRFSRCWKIMAGTPDLDCNEGRKQVGALKEFNTLKDALIYGIIKHVEALYIQDKISGT